MTDPLDFQLKGNLIVVDAMINDSDVRMILDTGAGTTIVSKTAAKRLGLENAGTRCAGMGAGGDVQMETVRIDTLRVGAVTHSDMTSMAMDLSAICDKLEYEVDGIIGYDFLSGTRLAINYRVQQIELEEAVA